MKTLLMFCLSSLLFLMLPSFKQPLNLLVNKSYLAEEELVFDHTPKMPTHLFLAGYRLGAYDGSRYTFRIDSTGLINVFRLRSSRGISQNKLMLYLLKGVIGKKGDTSVVRINTVYEKIYLVEVKQNGIIDSIPQDATISLCAQTLDNAPCRILVESDRHTTNLFALPVGFDRSEIFKRSHSRKSIGVFSYMQVKDKNGKVKNFPSGEYVIIGGNSLRVF